ncbi:MAG: hypothetical protein Q4F33_00385 [Mycoplasmatota bacterium]|nr:hypothetical protein [Mycoplasmatota bacterium]
MNLTINPGAATDDAAQIDSIVATMEDNLETLNGAITRNIPNGVQTSWSETVRENWSTYYGADIPAAMADMKLSATNLRMAVDQALKYSSEQ